jgi:alginate O-acetyltransferase complex protein AlgI
VFNVAVVFIVSGVWHGAGWNFMLWGVLHGAYLIVNRLAGRRFTLPRFPAWVLTVAATFFAWLCFYERDTGALFKKMHMLCTPAAYSAVAAREAMTHLTPGNRLVLACFLLLAAGTLLLEWLSVARRNEPYYFLRRPAVVTTLVLLTVLLAPGKYNAFIYFAF